MKTSGSKIIDNAFEKTVKEKGIKYAIVTALASILTAVELGAKSEEEMIDTMKKLMPKFKVFPKEYMEDAFKIVEIMSDTESIYAATDRFYGLQ